MSEYRDILETLHAHDCIRPDGSISTYNSVPGNVALGSWERWQNLVQSVRNSGGRSRFVAPMRSPVIDFRKLSDELRTTTTFVDVVAEPVYVEGQRTYLVRFASQRDQDVLTAALEALKD